MNKRRVSGLLIVVLIASITVFSGCVEEGAEEVVVADGAKYAKDGDTVKVHYTGTLDDGTVFDSSIGGDPLSFIVGGGSMIKGFDGAVNGMMIGENKTVTIPADEAYGPYREDRVQKVNISELPEGSEPEVGDTLSCLQNGVFIEAPIVEVTESNITLDANHRLAGEDLTFLIELVEIV